MQSTARFYSQNRALFTELKATLEDYLPHKVIETVQNQVNKNVCYIRH